MADTHNKPEPFLAVSLRWVPCHFVVFFGGFVILGVQ